MKRANFSICIPLLFVTLLMFLAGSTSSADDKIGPLKKIATITIPGGLTNFDISWVDSDTETYYLANRTSTPGTGRIEIIDAEHDTYVGSIKGFVGQQGPRLSGPNGVVVIDKQGESGAGEGHDRKEHGLRDTFLSSIHRRHRAARVGSPDAPVLHLHTLYNS